MSKRNWLTRPTFPLSLLLVALLAAVPVPQARAADDTHSPRYLVHLLDYLAKDYGGAVSDGKIVSESEYEEQVAFSAAARDTLAHVPSLQGEPAIKDGLTQLNQLIQDKAPAEEVTRLARSLQAAVIRVSGMEVTPRNPPDRVRGAKVFAENCASCHGAEGRGDGPAGAQLDPKPANFHDAERMDGMTSFQSFNVVRLGIPGTGMRPFPELSDDDVWNVADYVIHLRDNAAAAQTATVAGTPGGNEPGDFLGTARRYYEESRNAWQAGDLNMAKMRALSAYLEGIEPLEPRVRASDPDIVIQLETDMGSLLRALDPAKKEGDVGQAYARLTSDVDAMEKVLGHGDMSPSVAFVAGAAILLREGFEAVLMIIALLGVIKATGAQAAARWVHAGWLSAVACGVVAWFFSGWLLGMSGASREAMEAGISLFAVGVLLVVGFWLHRQTEISRWKAFIDHKVKAALEGRRLFALFSIAFIAVFREAFETVIFLRAIWQESGDSARLAMGAGVVGSFLVVLGIATAILRYSARFPIRKLFGFSAALMAFLAFVLTGKGVHSLQEVGVAGVTSLGHWRVEWLGIFPSVQTLGAQVLVLLAVAALWFYGRRPAPSTGMGAPMGRGTA